MILQVSQVFDDDWVEGSFLAATSANQRSAKNQWILALNAPNFETTLNASDVDTSLYEPRTFGLWETIEAGATGRLV